MKKLFTAIVITLVLFMGGAAYCVNQPQNIGYAKTDSPFQLFSTTLVAIQALTPDTTGQLIHCSNCVSTPVLVATGTAVGAWAAVSVSSGATTGLGVAK